MSDVQSQEEFESNHREIYKDILADHSHIQLDKAASPVLQELSSTIQQLVSNLDPARSLEPAEVFRAGLESMDTVDRGRFILDNYLEGLKRGESPSSLWERYKTLRLVHGSVDAPTQAEAAIYDSLYGKSQLKRWGCAAAQIAVNAFKSIPAFVEIKPMFSMIGPIPVLSFELSGKGKSIKELFEMLRKPGRFHRGNA